MTIANSRRDGHDSIRASSADPTNPIVCVAVVRHSVLEVPVISSIRKVAIGVVRCDSIASPARHSYTQCLDVTGGSREVDTVDVWVDSMVDRLYDAKEVTN